MFQKEYNFLTMAQVLAVGSKLMDWAAGTALDMSLDKNRLVADRVSLLKESDMAFHLVWLDLVVVLD